MRRRGLGRFEIKIHHASCAGEKLRLTAGRAEDVLTAESFVGSFGHGVVDAEQPASHPTDARRSQRFGEAVLNVGFEQVDPL